MMTLFPDEIILVTTPNDVVSLTSHRICYNKNDGGIINTTSIMLEQISSCSSEITKPLWMYYLAILLVAVGFLTLAKGGVILIFLGIIMVIIYRISKKCKIIIGSSSGKIELNITGMENDLVKSFINKIEHAKHERVSKLMGQ